MSYINILLNQADNFDIIIENRVYSDALKNFYERESEYVENFLSDFTNCLRSEFSFLQNFYNYYFEYIFNNLSYSPNPNVH